MKKLSIVIPAYNEEAILESNLNTIIKYLDKKFKNWEIVVVDDGSRDKTSEIAKKFSKKNVLLVRLVKNQGKGAALKKGMLKANAESIVFMDADLSVSLNHLDKMVKMLDKFPVVIGSRRVEGSKIVLHQPFIREKLGLVFTFLTKKVTGVNIRDFTCGFKGFKNEAAKKVFTKSIINRWAYDSEIIFLSRKMGYEIFQLPVNWINRRESRVRLGKDVISSLIDLFKIRVNDFKGLYD